MNALQQVFMTVVSGTLVMAFMFAGTVRAGEPTEVRVKPGQSLNEAIDEVDGAVRVRLPAGITTFEPAGITRADSVHVRGDGERRTILRAGGELTKERIRETDGDVGHFVNTNGDASDTSFVMRDLTLDLAHHPSNGIVFNLGGDRRERFLLENVTVRGINLIRQNLYVTTAEYRANGYNVPDGMVSKQGFNGTALIRGLNAKEALFRNVTYDLARLVNRSDHNYHIAHGSANRWVVDEDCLHVGNTYKNFRAPKNKPPFNPGHPEEIRGYMGIQVREKAELGGTFVDWEQYAYRMGSPNPDARIHITCDVRRIGNGDLIGGFGGGTYLVEDVTIKGHMQGTTGPAVGDRGIGPMRGGDGSVRSDVTVRDCTVHGPIMPIHVGDGNFTGSLHVENVDIKGGSIGGKHWGIVAPHLGNPKLDEVTIRDVTIRGDRERGEYFGSAIMLKKEGNRNQGWANGAEVTVENVKASGFLNSVVQDHTPEHVTVTTKNLRGTPAKIPIPEDVDLGLQPRKAIGISGWGIWRIQHALPGVWGRVADVMKGVRGKPTFRKDQSDEFVLSYSPQALGLKMEMVDDDTAGASKEKLEEADRLRIGLAPGKPGASKQWVEVDFAVPPHEKRDGTGELHVRARKQPGGERVETTAAGNVDFASYNRDRWMVRIPWSVAGIDPSKKRFSMDVAYIDVDEGKESGVLGMFGRSGVIGERSGTNAFKHAALLNWGRFGVGDQKK